MAEQPTSWKDAPKTEAADEEESSSHVSRIGTGKKANIKKSFLQRFRDTFIADDITREDIREFIMRDVIVPAIQDAIMDGINGALGMMFGISISRAARVSKSSSGGGTKINYSGRFTNENSRKDNRRSARESRNRDGGIEYQMHDSEDKAYATIKELENALKDYGRVSRADYYDCFGKETEFTDNNWGWTNLSGMYVQRVPKGFIDEETGRYLNGYAVIMPREVPLD